MHEQDQCQSEQLSKDSKPKLLIEFDKATIEEKIKRLHLIVKELRHSLQYAYQLNSELSHKIHALESHQHGNNGELLVKVSDNNRQYPGSGLVGAQMSHDLLA